MTPSRAPGLRTWWVWALFVVVHGWLVLLGTGPVAGAYQDLQLYRSWVDAGLADGTWPVLDGPWVYPVAALLPMLATAGVAGVDDPTAFTAAWCGVVAVLDALAVALLLRARSGRLAAAWWLAFVAALGPVAVGRVDGVVAPLSVVALLLALRAPRTSTALVTLAAWVKVAPGAAVLPLLLTARRPWRDVVVPGALVCAAVIGATALLGGGGHVLSFVQVQERRGLQVESVAGTPWLVAGLATDTVAREFEADLVTYELRGPGTQATADALGAVLPVAVLALVALLAWRRHREGAALWTDDARRHDLVLRGSFALALVLLVTNKVGSPQFVGWLAPPVAVALAVAAPRWRAPAVALLGVAAATQWVFPWWYAEVLDGVPRTTLLLAARNVALVVLLGVAVRYVVRPPGGGPGGREGTAAGTSGAVRCEPGQQVGTGAAVVDG